LPNSFPGPIPAPILSDAVFEIPVLLNPLGTTKSKVKRKEDLKAVAETGFSLTPPGRVYEIGKGAL
jgi:hypothetical protein